MIEEEEEFEEIEEEIEEETEEICFEREDEDASSSNIPSSSRNTLDASSSYAFIPQIEIRNTLNSFIENIQSFTSRSADDSTLMCIHCHWNQDQLLSLYADNSSKLLKDCGAQLNKIEPLRESFSGDEFTCPICYCDYPKSEKICLPCGHGFCLDCCRGNLLSSLGKGVTCISTACMQSGCNLIYPPSMWKKVLKSLDSKDEDYERYMFYLQQNFVSENRDLRWCPAPGCTWISQRKGFDTSVICKCGRGYCFACGDEIHTPVTCEILKKWYARIEDQKDSGDVYLSTLKPCPKCTVLLDKDGGCNHMTCKSCRYEFCWICMGPWKQHGQETGGYYSCNRPVDESLLGESKNAKQRLDYFEHYHTRFVEHGNSQRFSQNQLKSISSKIQKFNSLNACAENVGEFIREGVEVVAECRRILKYTYAWGFFMEKGPQKDLFEFLQRDLEAETERLSELTEEPVEKIDRLIHLEYIKSSKKYLINLLDGLSDFQGKA